MDKTTELVYAELEKEKKHYHYYLSQLYKMIFDLSITTSGPMYIYGTTSTGKSVLTYKFHRIFENQDYQTESVVIDCDNPDINLYFIIQDLKNKIKQRKKLLNKVNINSISELETLSAEAFMSIDVDKLDPKFMFIENIHKCFDSALYKDFDKLADDLAEVADEAAEVGITLIFTSAHFHSDSNARLFKKIKNKVIIGKSNLKKDSQILSEYINTKINYGKFIATLYDGKDTSIFSIDSVSDFYSYFSNKLDKLIETIDNTVNEMIKK